FPRLSIVIPGLGEGINHRCGGEFAAVVATHTISYQVETIPDQVGIFIEISNESNVRGACCCKAIHQSTSIPSPAPRRSIDGLMSPNPLTDCGGCGIKIYRSSSANTLAVSWSTKTVPGSAS